MFPSLPSVIDYFRNVESIGSLNITLDTVNTEGDALVISTNPGLQRVDLSRLQIVRYGNVRVRNNPDLCYVGDFQTTTGNDSVYLSEVQLILPTGSDNFMSVEACSTFPALAQLHLPRLCVLLAMVCLRLHGWSYAFSQSFSSRRQQQHAAVPSELQGTARQWLCVCTRVMRMSVCLIPSPNEAKHLQCLMQYVTLVKGPTIQIQLPIAVTIVL